MGYENTLPTKVPEKGFYYHYKHDPAGEVNNYAYEVLGVGHHTEDDCRPEDANMVVYRPLYEAFVYTHGRMFDLRPLDMWMGEVEREGKIMPRFSKVTDPQILEKLRVVKEQMYAP